MGNTKELLRINVADGHTPTITLFMPVTRKWRVYAIAKMLAKLNTDGLKVNVLLLVDSPLVKDNAILDAFERCEVPMAYQIRHTGKDTPSETKIEERRTRIMEMLKKGQSLVGDTDFVFMVEDDTEIAPNALQALIQNYKNLTEAGANVGIISGVQVGRWGYRMIGGWRVDDITTPKKVATIPFNKSAILERIDGSGLYCYLVPTALFKAHEWYWHDICFSVDMTFGLELRRQGYQNFIDWTIVAGHVMENGNVLVPNEKCQVVAFEPNAEGVWDVIYNKKKGATS